MARLPASSRERGCIASARPAENTPSYGRVDPKRLPRHRGDSHQEGSLEGREQNSQPVATAGNTSNNERASHHVGDALFDSAQARNGSVMRAPRTVVGFTLAGLFRGALTGYSSGAPSARHLALVRGGSSARPALAPISNGSVGRRRPRDRIRSRRWLLSGLLRYRFNSLSPVAAGVTFLLTSAIGCVLTILSADRWQHFAVFSGWSVGIAILFGIVARITSRGLTGISRERDHP